MALIDPVRGRAGVSVSQRVRLGVYGGSFDPIHYGHLAIAEEARVILGLEGILFVPAARQPLKNPSQTSAAHRLAMVRLACANNPAFVPDDLELHRPPPSYTVTTVETLHERYGSDRELCFIIGADAAADLPGWHRIAALLSLARIIIVGRPGYTVDLPALIAALPALAGRVTLIDGPGLEISSSDLRLRLRSGLPVRYQVPEAVRLYIAEQQLYQHEA